jgi:hypothetical protein
MPVAMRGWKVEWSDDAAPHREPDFWRSITAIAATPTTSASKVLNLGSHRWSFKPELSFSFPTTRRNQGAEGFHQVPLPGLEAHISCTELDAEFAHFSEPCVRQGPRAQRRASLYRVLRAPFAVVRCDGSARRAVANAAKLLTKLVRT